MRAARNLRRAPHEPQLPGVLDQPHRGDRRAYVDHRFRRGDAGAYAVADLVERRGDRMVPACVKAQRGIQGGLVAAPFGELAGELGDRVRLVEAEDLARSVGPIAEAVPDLTLRVLVAAEQHLS